MTTSELKESCFDGKYDILRLIATGAIVYDRGILGALKCAEIHKTIAIKKFEKYIVSYVAAGSLFRGDANPNDIDVYVVVDDTDVKKMSRIELKDKLRAIIQSQGFEAAGLTGIKAGFHVQTYILTDFWDSVKDANPVIFTFLRDGVPLFDRGVFMPWKLLLQMGRIKPSPESIDMNMEVGEKLVERVKQKLLSVAGEDIYYACLNPAQAALMMYGIPPPTPRETVKLLEEIFVKKEKLLEKKYVDILAQTIAYYKDIEHGKIKNVTGKQIDDLLTNVDAYLKRIRKLFNQIEKETEKKEILSAYDNCISVTRDLLYLKEEKDVNIKQIDKIFKEKLVDKGVVTENFFRILKQVIKAKKDYDENKISRQEITKISKEARTFVKMIVEYIQRLRGVELERTKIRFKYGDKIGEALLLDDVAFITNDLEKREQIDKADLIDGSLKNFKKSSLEELEKHIAKIKIPPRVFIKEKIFEDLKSLFGKDIEILVNY